MANNLRSSWSFQRKAAASEDQNVAPQMLRASWQNSLSSSGGTLNASKWKMFGTVSSGTNKPTKRSSAVALSTLFGESATSENDQEKRLQELDNGDWNISVAEKKSSGKRNKNSADALTIYLSTPHTSRTLVRTYTSLIQFDTALRSHFTIENESAIAQLSEFATSSPSPPRKRRGPIFATLSRTLSPARSRQLRSILPETSSRTLSPSALAQISGYLSAIAKRSDVRESDIWTKFFRLQSEADSESSHVQRRVKRIRSDPTLSPHGTMRAPVTIDVDDPMSSRSQSRLGSESDSLAEMAAHAREISGDDRMASAQPALPSVTESPAVPTADMSTVSEKPVQVVAKMEEAKPEQEKPIAFPVTPVRKPRKVTPISLDDFKVISVLGKGCAGKVMLVRQKQSEKLYAMKAIRKHHVLAHRELLHTLTEQSVLKTMAEQESNPFVVKLHYSFHDKNNLFLVLDYHPGGDLATQLARWGRLGRDRARFYTAEIAQGLQSLHHFGVIYRDLKPENILISADGHIVLTDFGLSKQFPRPNNLLAPLSEEMLSENGGLRPGSMPQTRKMSCPPENWQETERETCTTFCGTAEYLAPEVLLGEPYSYECDAWSLGTMLYEMLTGMTPFYADNHTTMYRRVLHDELAFAPDDPSMDNDTKSILRGMLQKDPTLRMTDQRIAKHPYFAMIDWQFVRSKRYIPPYVPSLNPDDELDTSNFDETFLSMKPAIIDPDEVAAQGDAESNDDEDETKETKAPQSPVDENGQDVFCGYTFRGISDVQSIAEHEEEDAEMSPRSLDEETDAAPSTRPTSVDASVGHLSKDVSMSSEIHHRQQSSGLESLIEDQPLQPAIELHSSVSELPVTKEEEDENVIKEESEDEAADDWEKVGGDEQEELPSEVYNMRRKLPGSTFWARGIKDRYVLAVASVRPSPRTSDTRRNRKGIRSINSRLSSRSSNDMASPSTPGESPTSARRQVLSRSQSALSPSSPGMRKVGSFCSI